MCAHRATDVVGYLLASPIAAWHTPLQLYVILSSAAWRWMSGQMQIFDGCERGDEAYWLPSCRDNAQAQQAVAQHTLFSFNRDLES